MRELLKAAADLLLGVRCAGCEDPGVVLCAGCEARVRGAPAVRSPDPAPRALTRAPPVVMVSTGPYEDVVPAALHAYKEEPRTALAAPLGRALADAVLHALVLTGATGREIRLVPVPSRRSAVRARGFDAGGELALRAAADLRRRGLPVRTSRVLAVDTSVRDQAGLSAAERATNLAGAYRLRGSPVGRAGAACAVVVTDDVLTTGASAAEAVRVLGAAGTRPIAVATVAATVRRSSARRDLRPVCPPSLEKCPDRVYGRDM
ncbi:ComF family protein [Mumia sp. ZJ1417]|uniref:ComF family protein n=1 Tax=Mumia sp. ZJ1417 TaxID=2708082 RepID=UPI0014232A04|nr:ComF family protein [Mumia sp. ZJ1417]QMW65572.1 ComF family protein [Mumia sp. ZJ1417]